MANESLNNLADNLNNLSQTYDGSYTPASNDTLGVMADIVGYAADIPTQTVASGDEIALFKNFKGWANADANWNGYRLMQNGGTQAQSEAYCNSFIVPRATTLTIYALRDSTTIYKNTTSQGTINAGSSTSVSVAVGDLIQASRPVNIRTAQYDLGVIYMGWSGYAFAHRRDRNSGATLTMASLAGNTSYQVLYTTSDGLQTSLTSQNAGSITNAYDTATATLSSTRNYFIIANNPIACYVHYTSGTGMNDTLPLYPMDQDAKYGAFSAGGHMFLTNNASQNRSGANVTQQLFNRSSDGSSTTERNTSSSSPSVYIDISPGQTSGTFFTGPVQKVQAANGCICTAEQQADGNGSEMTPFVSNKTFGKATIITSATDWATCIGTTALTVYRRDSGGNILATQTMTGDATRGIFFTRFTNLSAGDVLETSGNMIVYNDSLTSLDDERINIMSSVEMELNLVSKTISNTTFGNDAEACDGGPSGGSQTAYFIDSFSNGSQGFTNSSANLEINDDTGQGWYYNFTDNSAFYYTKWSTGGGGVSDIASCR